MANLKMIPTLTPSMQNALRLLESGAKPSEALKLTAREIRLLGQHQLIDGSMYGGLYHITSRGIEIITTIDGTWEARRVADLEAENAALKSERDALRALLDKTAKVIAPIAGVAADEYIVAKPDYATLHVEDVDSPVSAGFSVQLISVGKSDIDEWLWFSVGHIRAIATIAAEIRAVE